MFNLCLKKFNLLSVNQLAAQIKLQEVWKSINIEKYGIILDPFNNNLPLSGHSLRPQPHIIFKDSSRLLLAEQSFHIDAYEQMPQAWVWAHLKSNNID